jgi:hypothetical protein
VDSPYDLQIVTQVSQTPNPTAVQNAILTQKPAGIVLHYSTINGQDYITLKANYATYTAANTRYSNYSDMLLLP